MHCGWTGIHCISKTYGGVHCISRTYIRVYCTSRTYTVMYCINWTYAGLYCINMAYKGNLHPNTPYVSMKQRIWFFIALATVYNKQENVEVSDIFLPTVWRANPKVDIMVCVCFFFFFFFFFFWERSGFFSVISNHQSINIHIQKYNPCYGYG